MKTQHYVRIDNKDEVAFSEFNKRNSLDATEISRLGSGTILYSMRLSVEEACALKLTCMCVGMLNFAKAFNSTMPLDAQARFALKS
jgi:hypothetical protein